MATFRRRADAMKDITQAIKERRAAIRRLQEELDTLERAMGLLGEGPTQQVIPLASVLKKGASGLSSKKKAHPKKGKFNPKSGVGHTVAVLRESGMPMHLDDIVERVKKRGLEVKKLSLGSSLAKLAKRGKVFFRAPAPNTFGLLEWESARQVAQA